MTAPTAPETSLAPARAKLHPYAFLGLVLFLLALYPFLVPLLSSLGNFGFLNFGVSTLILAGLALSWDILGGWAGQNSLGHAALVGIGAYAVTLLAEKFGLAPWFGVLAGMGLSALFAWGWGALTFRLRGSYFTLSSIAVAEIVRLVAVNESWLTGGAEGKFMPDLQKPFGFDLFDRKVEYFSALLFVGLVLVFLHWLKASRLGFYLRAVREDEDGAMAQGVNPARAKNLAFILSAAFTGLGGGLYAIFLQAFEPEAFMLLGFSIQIALLAIIGGRGTIYGPLVGALLINTLVELFKQVKVLNLGFVQIPLQESTLLIYGLLIVLVIVFLPKGVAGTLEYLRYRREHPLDTRVRTPLEKGKRGVK